MANDPIEERIREVVIGEREAPCIVIVDYDPSWPERFRQEAAKIRSALGEVALHIEHIGSTSVLRLAAKPIVDILLVVEDPSDEASHVPALESAGYILRVREPDFHEHRMFRTAEKDVHVHVLLPRLARNWALPAAARPPARRRRGSRTLRPDETRSGEQKLAEYGSLHRGEDRGGRRHHCQGR